MHRRLLGLLIVSALPAIAASCTTVGAPSEKRLDASDWRSAKSKLYHQLSLQYLRAGDHTRARRLLEQAVQFESRDAHSLELLTRLAYGDGDLVAAGAAARLLLQRQPNSVAALCTLGAIAETSEQIEDAEQYYRDAILAGPSDPRPYTDLHRFLLNQDRLDEAASLRSELAQRFPQRIEAFLDQGAYLASTERWSEAFMAYGHALDLQPQSADAAARYAFTALICDRPESVLDLGRRIAPHARLGSSSLTIAIAVAHIRDADFESALQELALLDQDVLDHPYVNALRGELLVRVGQLDSARLEFEAALATDPTIARAHAGLARIYLRQGRRHAGIRSLEKSLQFEPKNGVNRAVLAASLVPVDLARGREHLERARTVETAQRTIAEVERLFPQLVAPIESKEQR